MCRNILEGGRRCPCDSSEARRLRRHNQKSITKFRDELTRPVVKAEPAPTPEPEVPATRGVTIESVKATQQQIAELHEALTAAAAPHAEEQEFTVTFRDGTTETIHPHYPERMWSALERKTVEFGEDVTALANERAGFDAESIAELNPARIEAEEAVKLRERILGGLYKEFEHRYGVGSDRLLTNISGEFGYKHYQESDIPALIEDTKRFQKDAFSTSHWTMEGLLRDREELHTYIMEKTRAVHALQQVIKDERDTIKEKVTKHNEAVMSVLKEVRDIGNGQIQVAEKSAKKATNLLGEVAKVYPTAWVEESNARTAFRAKDSKGRAHYSDGALQKTYEQKHRSNIVIIERGQEDEHFGRDSVHFKFVPVDEEQWAKDNPGFSSFVTPGDVRYHRYYYDAHWMSYNAAEYPDPSTLPKPSGRGWELYTEKDADGNPERYRWRKPSIKRVRTSVEITPELTVTNNSFSTASHEFAHRVEGSFLDHGKRISQMQAAFLKRRTTSVDGTRQRLEHMGGGYRRNENTRPDDFAHRYMGKEYPGGKYHEILSMGAEAILAGAENGFLGGDNNKADYETRNFIIGLWGSA